MSAGESYFIDLLRHGETNGGAIFRGDTDSELTEDGLASMQAACTSVNKVETIYSSPMRRCRVFADAFAEAKGCQAKVLETLREYSFGDWEGRLVKDVYEEQTDAVQAFWRDPQHCPPPGGEKLSDFISRVEDAWNTIIQTRRKADVLVVSHGGPIRALLCHALGWPVSTMNRLEIPHASHSRLRIADYGEEKHISLVFFNRSPETP